MNVSPFLLMATLLLAGSDAAQAQWLNAPAFPTAGQPRGYAAGLRHGDDLYAIGGTPLVGGTDGAAHRLASGATSFVAVAPTEGAFLHAGAAVDALNRIVVFGGANASGEAGETYWWTPTDGNHGGLDARSGQAPAKLFAVASDAQGRIYSIGGGAGAAPTPQDPNSGRVERYDGVTDTWTVLASLPTPVADAAACFDGQGHVVVIGGFDAAGARTANVARFDVATGTWSDDALPDMPVALNGHRAALGADGRIYVVGGSDGTTRATTWVLDLQQWTWTPGPAMAHPRRHFALALGADDFLYAMGGLDDAGGTDTSEKLFTPPCPQFTAPPTDLTAFLGAGFSLSVSATGGPPIGYIWRKDGVQLADGPSAGGGAISGATTAHLSVTGTGAGDAGAYDCVASNACGAATSPAATVTLVPPAALPAWFMAHSIHPSGKLTSTAFAVDGDRIGGGASQPVPPYSSISRPILWSAATGQWADLTPPSSVGGSISAIHGDVLAGWYWWPYTTPQGTGYDSHAAVWSGPTQTFADVQPTGWEFGSLSDTVGAHHAGTLRFDESSTNADGFYWPTTAKAAIKLTPPGAWGSSAAAMDGAYEFGSVHLGFGVVHASRWTGGDAASFLDLNPAGASRSSVSGAGDGLQVGSADFGGGLVPVLWSGSAATAVQLLPAAASGATLNDTQAGLQVGSANLGGGVHAVAWAGTAASAFDLHPFLPADFGSSMANALDVDDQGRITIVGSGFNTTLGRTEALLWRGSPSSLWQEQDEVSAALGGSVTMHLDAGPALAGRTYLILGSITATSPGTPLAPGVVLPLVFDAYTDLLFALPNTLVLPSFGTLDASGRATAAFALPPGAVTLTGPLQLHHAYVVAGAGGGPKFASNATTLTIVP